MKETIKNEKEEVLMYLDTQELNLLNLSQIAELTSACSNLSEEFESGIQDLNQWQVVQQPLHFIKFGPILLVETGLEYMCTDVIRNILLVNLFKTEGKLI